MESVRLCSFCGLEFASYEIIRGGGLYINPFQEQNFLKQSSKDTEDRESRYLWSVYRSLI